MISRLVLGTEVAVGASIDVECNRHLIGTYTQPRRMTMKCMTSYILALVLSAGTWTAASAQDEGATQDNGGVFVDENADGIKDGFRQGRRGGRRGRRGQTE